jgi:hypothetical protein
MKYPFLINKKQIDEAAREGVNSAHFMVYVRGWPPTSGIGNSILTEDDSRIWGIGQAAEWDIEPNAGFMTIDPSFGGGDACMVYIWRHGLDMGNIPVAEMIERKRILIEVGVEKTPTQQIADSVRAIGVSYGISASHVVIDESATQTAGEMIMERWEPGVHRVNFASRPYDGMVSIDTPRNCEREYVNMVSCLYFQFVEYAKHGHIHGVAREAITEICRRNMEDGFPRRVEPKKAYKKRFNKSPDDADAAVLCSYALRVIYGIVPGELDPSLYNKFNRVADYADVVDYSESRL